MKALTATNIHVTIAAPTIALLPRLQPRYQRTLHAHNCEQRHANVPLACISAHSHYITHALYTLTAKDIHVTIVALTIVLLPCLQSRNRCTLHARDCQYKVSICMAMHSCHFQTLTLSRMHSTLQGTYRHRHPYQPPQRRQSCSSRDCNHATDASCTHATVNICHAHHDNAQLSFPDTCTIIYMHYIRVCVLTANTCQLKAAHSCTATEPQRVVLSLLQ
jgi:hypothetical protein